MTGLHDRTKQCVLSFAVKIRGLCKLIGTMSNFSAGSVTEITKRRKRDVKLCRMFGIFFKDVPKR